jgi:hypothetical protein
MKKHQDPFRRIIIAIALCVTASQAFTLDSIFEPIMRPFQFLPDYYLRFDMPFFALKRDNFFKRQYLSEPHPQLEFCFISYKNVVASVWQVDFLFNLGHAPGDRVFTVLNVAFGINPLIEVRRPKVTLAGGLAHRCIHNVDLDEFTVPYWNKLFASAGSPNYRLNTFYKTLAADSNFSQYNRVGWFFSSGYFVKEFFGIIDPLNITANDPSVWDVSSVVRYAFYRRTSWMFTMRGETTAGVFRPEEGYHVGTGGKIFWKQAIGIEAFFTRGSHGACLFGLFHLDDLPAAENRPAFSVGHSRFSKSGLLEIGMTFFN